MHLTVMLALASLTSARTLQPHDLRLSRRDGLPQTSQPEVGSVLGDNSSDGEVGPGNWTGACTQAASDLCKSPGNLGTLDQWVWSQNTNAPTCMVGLWQPNPTPTDPNVPKGVAPLTQDNCNLYFGQMQTTLQAIIQKNPSVDRGSVNIVNFPNKAQGASYSAGSQVDSTRPSFIMQPLKTVPQGLAYGDPGQSSSGGGQSSGSQSGNAITGPSKCGPSEPQATQYGVSCSAPQCQGSSIGAYCDSAMGTVEFCNVTGSLLDMCKASCRCVGP